MSAADPIVIESVQRLFERHASLDVVQHADADTFAVALWQAVVDAGLTHVLADAAADGGAGPGDMANAAAIVRLAGYHAAPIPIVEAMLGRSVAAACGWTDDDALGQLTLAAAPLPDRRRHDVQALAHVPWGRHAAVVYALQPHRDSYRMVRRSQAGLLATPGSDLAGQPLDRLDFVSSAATQVAGTVRTPDDLLACAALLRAAQMVGAMERTFDLALEHANTRVQFGKAIGKFQMVQQMMAQHANEVAAATAAVDLATDCTDWASLHFYAGIAKARASEAAALVSECAHQVTAAMGFAMEYPLHLFTRRLWSWRDDYGDEHYWNREIGAAAVSGGAAGLWPLLADGPRSLRATA